MQKNANDKDAYKELISLFLKPNKHYVAIKDYSKTVFYFELQSLIEKYTRLLKKHDNLLAAVFRFKRSADTIAFILAALFLRIPFVPCNINTKYDKIKRICNDLFVTGFFSLEKDSVVFVNIYDKAIVPSKIKTPIIRQENDIAYIIFTSGSTGVPKGVKISYRALLSFIKNIRSEFDFSVFERFLWVSSINFDISLLEILIPIINNKTIIVAEDIDLQIPTRLINIINREKIDFLQITPSQYELLRMYGFEEKINESLKTVFFGGEHIRKKHIIGLLKKNIQIYNMYGPTETTIWCSFKHIKETNDLSIGFGLGESQLAIMRNGVILSPYDQSKGELIVYSNQLFSGYTNSSTEDSELYFYENEKKYYKTGDIAKYNKDKQIIILGRIDNQVKINGIRIELEDIENIIEIKLGIKTIAFKPQQLTGLIVICQANDYKENLFSQLNNILYEYYPNGVFIEQIKAIKSFPLNENLKIDRNEVVRWFKKEIKHMKTAEKE
ncbi:MAG: AMP-binding protein [Clostridia bacterium]|nr:AMP-binding protein [Clostridia bacterium]MBQ6467376.1 AMP-binding protein [Clostridia bacterium]